MSLYHIWTVVFLFYLARPTSLTQLETIDQCERAGKQFCYTGVAPHRDLINEKIRQDPQLLALYDRLRPSTSDMIKEYEQNISKWRTKRESQTDCASLCCVTVDTTPPYSFFRDKDGWHEVATTPEFPVRVTFSTQTCTNENSPCRGVRSTDNDYQAQCEQVQFRHTIVFFNQTSKNIQTRDVTVPSGCRCRLTPKNPFKENDRARTVSPSSDHLKNTQSPNVHTNSTRV